MGMIPISGIAQNSKNDYNTVQTYPLPQNSIYDTTTILQLLQKGVTAENPDTAILCFRKSAQLSKQLGYTQGLVRAYNNLAVVYQQKNITSLYEWYIEQALQQVQLLGNDTLVQNLVIALTYSLVKSGKYDNALQHFHKSDPFFKNASPVKQAMIRNLIANAYFQSGYYDSAIAEYRKGIQYLSVSKVQDSTTSFGLHIGIGSVFYSIQLHDTALHYYTIARVIAEGQKNIALLASALDHLGAVYSAKKDYSKSKAFCLEGLEHARSVNSHEEISSCASCVALALINEDSAQKALPYSIEGYEYAKFASAKLGAAYLLGYNYALIGAYHQAEKLLNTALATARKNNMVYNISNVYQALAVTYAGLKQYRKAYDYQAKATVLRDSLIGKENAERVARIEQQYRSEEKDKRLAQQLLLIAQKESKLKEKNTWIGIIIAGGIILGFLITIRFRHKQKLHLQQHEITYLNERMKGEELERGRIAQELHDGVSVLISAAKMNHTTLGKKHKEISTTEEYKEVMQLLDTTGQELRSIAHNLVPEQLVRQSLPAAVQSFCSLIEKGHGLEIEIQHFGSWSGMEVNFSYTVYRIIQELIQNIVKHAQARKVLIQLLLHEDLLSLTVEDDGIGLEIQSNKTGTGLINIKKRVDEMKGTMVVKKQVHSGTAIEIELPFSK